MSYTSIRIEVMVLKQEMVKFIGSCLLWMACFLGIYLLFADAESQLSLNIMYTAVTAGLTGTVMRFYKDWKSLVFYALSVIALGGVFLTVRRGVSENVEFAACLILIAMFMYRPEVAKRASLPLQSGSALTQYHTVYMNMEGRRYTLMIEKLWMERLVHVSGTVHGLLKQGDVVMVLSDGMKAQKAIVSAILKNGAQLKEAADTEVELILDKLVRRPLQYGVISSIVPGQMPDQAQENPLLTGMMYEYGKFYEDENFRHSFFHVAEHSRFLVPVSLEQGQEGSFQSMRIGFKGIARQDNQEMKSFALFTDQNALHEWKALFTGGKAPLTMVITFHDACQIMLRGHSGIVINPFGPKYVYLTDQMVNQLTESPSYRKEFGDPHQSRMSFERKGMKKKK